MILVLLYVYMSRICQTPQSLCEKSESFKYITLPSLISEINVMKLCPGVDAPDVNNSLVIQRHIVPHVFKFSAHELSNKSNQVEYLRSDNCALLSEEEQLCSKCHKLKVKVKSEINWKKKKLMSPSKLKAPISLTSPTRMKLAMQQERLKFEVKISKMKKEIEKAGKPVEKNLSQDLCKIFSSVDNSKVPPFTKLFW